MEQFLWGIPALALPSIAIAAWQKPEFFLDFLGPWLSKITIAALVGAGIWQASQTYTRGVIIKLIPNLSTELLLKIQEAADMPGVVWIGLIGFMIYQSVMAVVAHGLVKHESKKTQ